MLLVWACVDTTKPCQIAVSLKLQGSIPGACRNPKSERGLYTTQETRGSSRNHFHHTKMLARLFMKIPASWVISKVDCRCDRGWGLIGMVEMRPSIVVIRGCKAVHFLAVSFEVEHIKGIVQLLARKTRPTHRSLLIIIHTMVGTAEG